MSIIDTTVRDHRETDPVQEVHQGRSRRTGVLIAVPVALVGTIAATTLAVGAGGADRPANAPNPAVSNPPAAYQPGGSVYDEQVPGLEDRRAGRGSGRYLDDVQVPQPGPRILVP